MHVYELICDQTIGTPWENIIPQTMYSLKKCDHLQLKFYSLEKFSLTRYSDFRLDLPVILSLALLLLSFIEIM